MLKFTSVSGSVRAITDITLTVTIDPITARIGTVGIVIIDIIAIPIITGANLIGIATPGWLEPISSQPNFLSRTGEEVRPRGTRRFIFLTSVKPPV
jgi:hypothetical protein